MRMKDKEIRHILIEYIRHEQKEARVYHEKYIDSAICDVMIAAENIGLYNDRILIVYNFADNLPYRRSIHHSIEVEEACDNTTSSISLFESSKLLLPCTPQKTHLMFTKRCVFCGVREGIRTPDLRFRKPKLYPAELHERIVIL